MKLEKEAVAAMKAKDLDQVEAIIARARDADAAAADAGVTVKCLDWGYRKLYELEAGVRDARAKAKAAKAQADRQRSCVDRCTESGDCEWQRIDGEIWPNFENTMKGSRKGRICDDCAPLNERQCQESQACKKLGRCGISQRRPPGEFHDVVLPFLQATREEYAGKNCPRCVVTHKGCEESEICKLRGHCERWIRHSSVPHASIGECIKGKPLPEALR